MKDIEKSLFNVVYALLNETQQNGTEITLKIIKEEVDTFRHLARFKDSDFTLVVNELQCHFTIKIGTSETLYQIKTPWIANYKQGKPNLDDFPFWNNYRRYLLEDLQHSSVVVNEIDDSTDAILDGMGNPRTKVPFTKKGMVIGYVQSGKTGNYVGLINKALDVGYNFIVVLAGLHNNLRQQTQFRIDEGVNGRRITKRQLSSVGVGKLPNRFVATHTQTLTTSDINGDFTFAAANVNGINFNPDTPLIAVIKKNVSPLTNLNNWLEDVIGINNQNQSDKAVLIIDDECDQASIDNNFKLANLDTPIPEEDGSINIANTPSKINELINVLLNKFNRRAYVGYTATPYANVFIPIDNLNYKNIFPEDFIVRLDQPSNYLGPEKYFGGSNDEDGLPGILEIDNTEVKDFSKKNIKKLIIPESLQTATKSYILAGGLRFFRNQENSHMSMLIHVSHLTSVQNQLGKIFNEYWKDLVIKIKNNDSVIWLDLKNLYFGNYSKGLNKSPQSQEDFSKCFSTDEAFMSNNFDLPKNFKLLHDYIERFISAIEIIITNSSEDNKRDNKKNKKPDEEINLNYHLYPKGRKIIAIGGNTMSRGLTFEGLHTSYFIRHARAFDTLMQMGRWFGYRTNYADLCRIFTSKDIVTDFGEICLADIKMNENISAMIRNNASPRDFLIQVRQSTTSLKITTKMGAAGPMKISWSGGEVISTLIDRKPDIIKKNHNVLISLLDLIKQKFIPQLDSNKIVFKEIPLALFEKFINEYSLVNNDGSLDFIKLFEYYKICKFDIVDLVIVGRQKGKNAGDLNYSFVGTEIGLAQRNSDDADNKTSFKVRNGKLTDANYLAGFVDEKLTLQEQKNPAIVCSYLKRPIISFLAMDPRYFFLKKVISAPEIPTINDVYLDLINDLGGFNQNQIIPYGISIATPSKANDGHTLIRESVLVNITVRDNINN